MGCAPAVLFRLQQTLQCPGTLAGEGHPEGPTTSRVLTPRPLVSGHHHLLSDLGGPRGSAPPPHETSILSPPPLITGPTASTLGGGAFLPWHQGESSCSMTVRQLCSPAPHPGSDTHALQLNTDLLNLTLPRDHWEEVCQGVQACRGMARRLRQQPRETERLDLALPRSGACVTNLLGVGAEGHFPEKWAKRRCCFGFQTSVSPILDLK